jgi:hypothetical protein
VIAAHEGSEELKNAMAELQNVLADYAKEERWHVADLRQKDVPLFDDEDEGEG